MYGKSYSFRSKTTSNIPFCKTIAKHHAAICTTKQNKNARRSTIHYATLCIESYTTLTTKFCNRTHRGNKNGICWCSNFKRRTVPRSLLVTLEDGHFMVVAAAVLEQADLLVSTHSKGDRSEGQHVRGTVPERCARSWQVLLGR